MYYLVPWPGFLIRRPFLASYARLTCAFTLADEVSQGRNSRSKSLVPLFTGQINKSNKLGVAIRPVSVEEVMGELSRMTHHLHCIGLRDDLPSLNAQGHNTVL
jgi:hypothetical protein